ncbi:nuclear transport factor 2 family protein [Streptomyces cylindrosporus]|uniref:Nuclear transport factor 2 family protein n=1 Tax=Streptomyces cylindrosporus TaxID=2927583 RepID=A0ABS9Y555_9ACTN|nr:nuclear transport factor 2 family protein [Streptomyces cylindrosporus]MCI3272357.1 nuclear transport factor 2 family protein [Streptomyces cylindrosporus]
MSMDASTNTRSVVEELLRRIREGGPERIAELYAQQGDWRLDWPETEHGRTATPWIRHRSTRADAAAHYRELAEYHVPECVATEVERILIDGSDAVVLGEIRQTARPTGRVTRHHVYEDSLAVAQAFEAESR